jgi:UDP-N-acetyl-D-glucosamine dehydrogenase
MIICVVGQGYVGLPISIHAANAGHTVYGLDTDANKIKQLKLGNTSSPEVSREQLLELQSQDKIRFLTNLEPNLSIQIFVIAVPTPLDKKRKPDLSMLKSACEIIAINVQSNSLIINESTSFIGTLRSFIRPLIEKNTSAENLKYAVAPERIDPGNNKWNIENTPRVISGLSQTAIDTAADFYGSFCTQIYKVDKPEIAEAAKLIENTFRQVNIALVNEMSEIANKYDFALSDAIQAASTKPFGYMPFYPSIGVGGHCIPIDPSYLSYSAKVAGIESRFIDLANIINLSMPSKVVAQIESQLELKLEGIQIQIVGIAYKPGTSDTRESPALELIRVLKLKGAHVIYHDPFVDKWDELISQPLSSDIDLGLIITAHNEIDFSIWKKANVKVLDLSANSNNYGWPKFL